MEGKIQLTYILFFSLTIAVFPQSLELLEYPSIKTEGICLTKERREKIIELNLSYIKNNKLQKALPEKLKLTNKFLWPVKAADSAKGYGNYVMGSFVDHDSSYPDNLLDYYGGTRTYDKEEGYNHRGTDIIPWPYPWYQMDNDLFEIVSMTSGVILGKDDGNYDRECTWNDKQWNAVYIYHDNGYIVWYGHLKEGSLLSKDVGDTVEAGEFLGIVGSSGSSTIPHLHLEVHDVEGNTIDPFMGPYNSTITSSLWEDQKPYYDSEIVYIDTHWKFPIYPECPQTEFIYNSQTFQSVDTVFLILSFRDLQTNQNMHFQIVQPNGEEWFSWDYTWDGDYYSAAYLGAFITFQTISYEGNWTFNVTYLDSVYSKSAFIDNPLVSIKANHNNYTYYNLEQNYPNPFNNTTIIKYNLPHESHVKLVVYDLLGRIVLPLLNKIQPAGIYTIEWNSEGVDAGVYFYRFIAGNYESTKKMILLK